MEEIHTFGDGEAKYFYFQDDQGNLLEAAWSRWDLVDDACAVGTAIVFFHWYSTKLLPSWGMASSPCVIGKKPL